MLYYFFNLESMHYKAKQKKKYHASGCSSTKGIDSGISKFQPFITIPYYKTNVTSYLNMMWYLVMSVAHQDAAV